MNKKGCEVLGVLVPKKDEGCTVNKSAIYAYWNTLRASFLFIAGASAIGASVASGASSASAVDFYTKVLVCFSFAMLTTAVTGAFLGRAGTANPSSIGAAILTQPLYLIVISQIVIFVVALIGGSLGALVAHFVHPSDDLFNGLCRLSEHTEWYEGFVGEFVGTLFVACVALSSLDNGPKSVALGAAVFIGMMFTFDKTGGCLNTHNWFARTLVSSIRKGNYTDLESLSHWAAYMLAPIAAWITAAFGNQMFDRTYAHPHNKDK